MKRLFWTSLLFAVWVSVGCENTGSGVGDRFLIRVENRVCTVADFNRAFEIAKLAYGEEALSEPGTLVEIRTRLLKEIADELVMHERAEELGLSVSDSELSAAVDEIKKDYPEDSFDRLLLENSISFAYWKESVRKKLLVERVEAAELEKDVLVEAGDIKKFHDLYFADSPAAANSEEDAAAFARRIVERLRKEKAREKYPSWIEALYGRYRVEINKEAWSAVIGDSSNKE